MDMVTGALAVQLGLHGWIGGADERRLEVQTALRPGEASGALIESGTLPLRVGHLEMPN